MTNGRKEQREEGQKTMMKKLVRNKEPRMLFPLSIAPVNGQLGTRRGEDENYYVRMESVLTRQGAAIYDVGERDVNGRTKMKKKIIKG